MDQEVDLSKLLEDQTAKLPFKEPELNRNKRLILLRHGKPDDVLTLREQVDHTAHQLNQLYPDRPIDAVLYSPVLRTVSTAVQLRRSMMEMDPKNAQRQEFLRATWLKDGAFFNHGTEYVMNGLFSMDNSWQTVVLVSHSTVAPPLAKFINTDVEDMELATAFLDFASAIVIDLSVNDWKDAEISNSHLVHVITQSEIYDRKDLQEVTKRGNDEDYTM